MHNYNNINIVSDDLKYQEICWFHTLEGIWHPVSRNFTIKYYI